VEFLPIPTSACVLKEWKVPCKGKKKIDIGNLPCSMQVMQNSMANKKTNMVERCMTNTTLDCKNLLPVTQKSQKKKKK
jgi:hypothetical protein